MANVTPNTSNLGGLGAPTGAIPNAGLGVAGLGGGLGSPVGGLGTPTLGAPNLGGLGATNFGTTGIASTTTGGAKNYFAIIGYIAPTDAVVKPAIDTKKARRIFESKASTVSPDVASTPQTVKASDGSEVVNKKTGVAEQITFDPKKFSMKQFRTFFFSDFQALQADNTLSIDMSNTRIEYFVVKIIADAAADANSYETAKTQLLDCASARDINSGIACLKKADLFSLMVAIGEASIKVMIGAEQVGYLLLSLSKVTRQTSTGDQVPTVNIIFTDNEYQKKRNLRLLANKAGERVPFAVHRKMTAPSNVPVTADKILNTERYLEAFPGADVTHLQKRLTIKKADFAGDEEKFKAAKAAQVYSYEEIKADLAKLSISEEVYKTLNTASKGKSSKGSARELTSKADQALQVLKNSANKN